MSAETTLAVQRGTGGDLDELFASLAPLAPLFDGPAPRPAPAALATPAVRRDRGGDWRNRAWCADDVVLHEARVSRDAFTADDHEPRERAAAVCEGCPVLDECYRTALAISVSYGAWGVWGGVDFSNRSATWRRRRREALAAQDGAR